VIIEVHTKHKKKYNGGWGEKRRIIETAAA